MLLHGLHFAFSNLISVWSWWWHFKIRRAGNVMSIRLMREIKGHTVNKNRSQGLNLGHLAPHLLLYLTKPHCLVLETLETSISKAPHELCGITNMWVTGMCWVFWNAEARRGLKPWCFYLEVAGSQWWRRGRRKQRGTSEEAVPGPPRPLLGHGVTQEVPRCVNLLGSLQFSRRAQGRPQKMVTGRRSYLLAFPLALSSHWLLFTPRWDDYPSTHFRVTSFYLLWHWICIPGWREKVALLMRA